MGNNARTFGQDLMRGEHTVGGGVMLDAPSKVQLAPGGGGGGCWLTKKPAAQVDEAVAEATGTSIFDPVLCELAYKWFCPTGGAILDPFAGGSVRGIVASHLGFDYTGIELRAEQVAANKAQAHIAGPNAPRWLEGDSRDAADIAPGAYDFLFSCPPYADLEVYSDDPRDLSTLAYPAFIESYRAIIAASCKMLRNDRFAAFVVGDVRDKDGCYYGFPGDTVAAFKACGLRLYNEAVLVTAVGSLPLRTGRQFRAGRKLGKTHQNILVFVKGDPKRAATACGGGKASPADSPTKNAA